MNRSTMLGRIVLAALVVAPATRLWAFPEVARETKSACATCHVNPAGGAALTDVGTDYRDDGKDPAIQAAKPAEYVGMKACRMCHVKEARGWAATRHAKAWAGLVKADSVKAAERATALKVELKGAPSATDGCIKCHVTGFHLTGGYPQADPAKTANLVNVTCEACHGPGSLHVAAAMAAKKKLINRAVSANLCVQCHTTVMSPTFKFEEFVKRGVHAVTR